MMLAGLAGYTRSQNGDTDERDKIDGTQQETQIEFWYSIGGRKGEVTETLAKEFSEENDSIEVSASHEGSYNETYDSTLQAIRAGSPPAISHLNAVHTLPTFNSGAFQPIQDILGDVDEDQYINAAVDYYRVGEDNRFMAIPFNMSTPVMMYNKDAFEEAGLGREAEDWSPPTFQNMWEMCQMLVDEGATEFGCVWGNHSWFIENWFALLNENFVNNDNGRSGAATEVNLDTDAAKALFDWWVGLYEDDLYLNAGVEAWGDARQAFVNQDAAMLIDSASNIIEQGNAAEEAGYEMGLLPIPSWEQGRGGVIIGGGGMFIPEAISDDAASAAGAFSKWIASAEQQARWHKETGYFPANKGGIQQLEEEGWFEENPGIRVAMDELLNSADSPAVRGPLIEPHPQVRDLMTEGVVTMFQGTPVNEALANMKGNIDKVLQRAA
jgi:sn-glycerol 3-phosphate transport system substrate-binding protein